MTLNPYTVGYAAFRDSIESPYPPASKEHEEWLEGYYDAQADQQIAENDPLVAEVLYGFDHDDYPWALPY